MLSLDDTIAAISTPVGEGGIGIVRVSGARALEILKETFFPAQRTPGLECGFEPESHRFYYGHVIDRESGEKLDEVLAVWMAAPRTYTRQDVVELHAHGGVVALRLVLDRVLRSGARLAQPGEFTLRAFLNGRIDLSQAEAVMDIVRARTEAGLRIAVAQLDGRISAQVKEIRAELVEALAAVEAALDFPEDEIPPIDLETVLASARARLAGLLARADQGMIYRQGVRTAIVGRPNVGKSSLLNALLKVNRAIVTPIPGTTRDTLEETLNLQGIPLCLVDTAGITNSHNPIEVLGIERSRAALQQSDLVLMVVDGSEALRPEDQAIADLIGNRTALLVVNKADLPAVGVDAAFLPCARRVRVSALNGDGLDELEGAIAETVFSGAVLVSDAAIVSNPRHSDLLRRALESVTAAEIGLDDDLPPDLISVDLSGAVNALGELTGETAGEDVLEAIFRNFCVGK